MAGQSARRAVVITPDHFSFNAETAADNAFMSATLEQEELKLKVMAEHRNLIDALTHAGVELVVVKGEGLSPDECFPNNWFSTHSVSDPFQSVLYPMATPSRRREVECERVRKVLSEEYPNMHDMSAMCDADGDFVLEGTGSLVLDRVHKKAYCGLSVRATDRALDEFCTKLGYEKIDCIAKDGKGTVIYHTNVWLSIGSNYVVVCEDAVVKDEKGKRFLASLHESGKTIIPISHKQVLAFCGNILELENEKGEKVLAMSEKARRGFSSEQMEELEKCVDRIVSADFDSIETHGGGGVRCCLAELF
eukprot:CAMPEP_0113884054 /NCGR_PEP_ID=MMETSP0780_2-20120614/9994_1 /TAXON_ID=652834 /ORGANISM="Palpitomonas bilix" /LENGTH=305 /DNA_ID=CAMNT_0000871531 /DNA_START=111 /DNA_END=1028 /DNA_ORIENTATION=+ /assembly_acc=CAM_ASM_000599